MTLLDLAKRCGETIQVVAQAIEDEFKDKISLSSNTHVPDKYVSAIITKFRGAPSSSELCKPINPKKGSVYAAQTYGEELGGATYRIATLAKDLNVSISSIVEHFDYIFQGNLNPNSRVNEDLANSIIRYFGKEYLIQVPKIPNKSKKVKVKENERSAKEPPSDSDIAASENKSHGTQLSGKALLKHLKKAVNKKILQGSVVNYDRSRDAYFVNVLGFKSLLYNNEVLSDHLLETGETIDVVPVKVDGNNSVEYMTVSMKRAWEIKNNTKSKRPSKRQLDLIFAQLEIGAVITGRVSRIEENYIIIEYNGLRGIIYKKDLFYSRINRIDFYWQINAPITAKVISKEIVDEKRQIRFSHKECIPNIWNEVSFETNDKVQCSVVASNDEGVFLSVCTGMEGFIHKRDMSHYEYLSFRKVLVRDDYVDVYIKVFDPATETLKFYTTPLRDDEWWDGVVNEFKIDTIHDGEVFDRDEYGVWIKFDNMLETYIPRKELYWYNAGDEKEYAIGDSLRVLVTRVDNHNRRIDMSVKLLEPDPWMLINDDIKDKDIQVKVIDIKDQKVLVVETLDNLHLRGIIRFSEISWQYSSLDLPESLIPAIGQTISARVIVIDRARRILSLSIRQLCQDPWLDLEPGLAVRGKLGSLVSSGVIEVTLENGLKATTNELDLHSLGDCYIDFKIVECSRQTKTIQVSHSQLQYDRINESIIMNFFGTSKN